MTIGFEPVIGLEVHAELETKSKMFCSCQVVDSTVAEANIAVCPVCSGMPGTLPVVNKRAVEYALRVALALQCEIAHTSIFARKNYFYPDLPKGYQISQYEQPLARNGRLTILTNSGEKIIRIRRVHLEEDTGKLTHINRDGESYSLVDLNRAGVPLLEIVSEPDLRSAEEVRAYATGLRSILRYLEVNSGDMQKGVMRIEPNVSVRPIGENKFGTRVEIKNLNSFRALERAVDYEIHRQSERISAGERIIQETVGWDENKEITFTQRVKEEEDDYRYFPEPDLPPLVVEASWVEEIRSGLPELPAAKAARFVSEYGLSEYDAEVLVAEQEVADYFEGTVSASGVPAKTAVNWISGEIFSWLNQSGETVNSLKVSPQALGELLQLIEKGEINQNTGKSVLAEMLQSGQSAPEIVEAKGLRQVSDQDRITEMIEAVLDENPEQVAAYLGGKESLLNWFFGQVMRAAKGQANPQIVREMLNQQLARRK